MTHCSRDGKRVRKTAEFHRESTSGASSTSGISRTRSGQQMSPTVNWPSSDKVHWKFVAPQRFLLLQIECCCPGIGFSETAPNAKAFRNRQTEHRFGTIHTAIRNGHKSLVNCRRDQPPGQSRCGVTPNRVHWWYRFGLGIPILRLVEETWRGDIGP